MEKCDCGRSSKQYCLGWHELSHHEWQTKKITAETNLRAEFIKQDYQEFVSKQKSI